MNILDRIATRILSRKQSETYRALLATGGKAPIYTPKDYARLAEAGYQNCVTVYACANLIANSAGQVPIELYQGNAQGEDEEIEQHPILDILEQPNPLVGGARFTETACLYELLAGNSFVERVGPNNGPPRELYTLRPDRIKVVPGTVAELIGGYEYTVNGAVTTLEANKIRHLKRFHPTNDWYGLSPLEVASKGIDIQNFAQDWNSRLLVNDATPRGALKVDGMLSDEQFKRLRRQVRAQINGLEGDSNWLLLEGGTDWKQFGLSPKDMDWLKADEVNTRKICSVFKVAPELIGDSANKTYSNYQEARKALYLETVLPWLDWYLSEMSAFLCPLFGEGMYLAYDKDSIDALQEDRSQIYTRLASAYWLSLNEKRVQCGYDEVDGGDAIMVPVGLVPFEGGLPPTEPTQEELDAEAQAQADSDAASAQALAQGKEPAEEDGSQAEGQAEEDGGGKKPPIPPKKGKGILWADAVRKGAKVAHFELRVKARERSLTPIAEKFLREQGARIVKNIRNLPSVNARGGITFSPKDEAQRWLDKSYAFYREAGERAMEMGLAATKGELPEISMKANPGQVINFTRKNDAKLKKMILYSGTKIADTTMSEVMDSLEQAETENWTVTATAEFIAERIDEGIAWKARRISRTETAKVENWGELEGYKEAEFVDGKGWLCAFVETSREAHKKASNDYEANPIPLDDPFVVDGETMMYPGDPTSASPGNVINCLCALYPEVLK